MKKLSLFLAAVLLLTGVLAGCNKQNKEESKSSETQLQTDAETKVPTEESPIETTYDGVEIVLSDTDIKADGESVSSDTEGALYAANDIVYYEEGHDFTYGEGSEEDAHSQDEASAHTVLHITEPGQYILSGKLSKGQIAVDLGEEAEEDPEAVVTLVLNGLDITCEVAPAIIFYNVYECGSTDTEAASKDVDTSNAGANVVIADGSVNTVNGSYVARIYKPDSVVLTEDGSAVEDAKKLHKYDGAFYSKMSMNVNGGAENSGILNINAENEGLDSELHLTVNGGNINIVSGNDGINTNEDYVSVTTINGGALNILINGETGEGDGIDSNGWLVINGGSVTAQACAFSGDAGIDSDMGIHINGGKVFATGNMLDRISESEQNYAVFTFAENQNEAVYSLKNAENETVLESAVTNSFTYLIVSDESFTAGDYTLWCGDIQLQGRKAQGQGMGMGGGMTPPDDMELPEGMELPENFNPGEMPEGELMRPDDMELPEGMEMPEDFTPGEMPEGEFTRPDDMEPPEGMEMPEDFDPEQRPGGSQRPNGGEFDVSSEESSNIFAIEKGGNYFEAVTEYTVILDDSAAV